jgi:hypothetical protein
MASEAAVAFTEPQDIAEASEPEAAVETAGAEAFSVAGQATDAAPEPETVAESRIAPEAAAFEDPAVEPATFTEVTDEFSLDAAAEAEDDAILEAIALEMAAPDPDFDEIIEPVEMEAAIPEPMVAEAAAPIATEMPEPIALETIALEPAAAPVVEEPVEEAPIAMESLARLTNAIAEAAAEVREQPAPVMAAAATFSAATTTTLPMPSPLSASLPEQSLGATILASGILQKPRAAANDPMAPIRRMTQAEKIAFFS